MPTQSDFHAAVEVTATKVHALVAEASKAIGVSPRLYHKELCLLLGESTESRDGRAVDWRVRVRLFDAESLSGDPEADTDPSLPADAPGAEIVHGLADAAHFAAEVTSRHHKSPCAGLGAEVLKRKVRSMRVQISNRQSGFGFFNAEYEVAEMKLGSPYARKMLLRCDVAKVDPDAPADDRNPITRIKPINRARLAGVRNTEGE